MALNFWKCLDSLDLSATREDAGYVQTSGTRRTYKGLQVMTPGREGLTDLGLFITDEERREAEREQKQRKP